jgi:hypothetical protein
MSVLNKNHAMETYRGVAVYLHMLLISTWDEYEWSDSESELLYDWRFTVNRFVLATSPLRLTASNFIFQLNACGYSPYVTSSLTTGWVCRLQLLLVFASAYELSALRPGRFISGERALGACWIRSRFECGGDKRNSFLLLELNPGRKAYIIVIILNEITPPLNVLQNLILRSSDYRMWRAKRKISDVVFVRTPDHHLSFFFCGWEDNLGCV